ncbi:MAG: TMEM165/GDT1 family protein [Thaumarchaeota archaeon]|nr:TMEM165/GDT1 family protein [Nitrososphaerota archaeon]
MLEFMSLIATIALAEVGDKTQISILLLSTQTRRPIKLLLGVFAAFLVVDGVAVVFGSMMKQILPAYILRIFGSLMFMILGIFILIGWRSREQTNIERIFKNSFTVGFSATFLAEWCDKTQISTCVLATRFNYLEVFAAAMTALIMISISTMILGRMMLKRISEEKMLKISGVGFLLVGILFLLL